MKKTLLLFLWMSPVLSTFAQQAADGLAIVKTNNCTSVKDQGGSGTCWSFSTLSLVEAETMRKGLGTFNLSEMFVVRNIYKEKAKNYLLRQGAAQFGPGGLGHDLIRSLEKYGAIPEESYSGMPAGKTEHDHKGLDSDLKDYLDGLLKSRPLPNNWLTGFDALLDKHLGTAPEKFDYKGKSYTAKTFATQVLKFSAADYITVTSFSHAPFYTWFILEAPDNFANGAMFNVPLAELVKLTEDALKGGYTLMWDADVSNKGFSQSKGYAMLEEEEGNVQYANKKYTQAGRQALYENLTTQDDHLMHMVGIEKNKAGLSYFIVKNSWGEAGIYKGFIHVSENYYAINTVSIVLPKAALGKELTGKIAVGR